MIETFAQSLPKGIVDHSAHIEKLLNMLQRIKKQLNHLGTEKTSQEDGAGKIVSGKEGDGENKTDTLLKYHHPKLPPPAPQTQQNKTPQQYRL